MIDKAKLKRLMAQCGMEQIEINDFHLHLAQVIAEDAKKECAAGEWKNYPQNKPRSNFKGAQYLVELTGFDDDQMVFSSAFWDGEEFSRNDIKRFAEINP